MTLAALLLAVASMPGAAELVRDGALATPSSFRAPPRPPSATRPKSSGGFSAKSAAPPCP